MQAPFYVFTDELFQQFRATDVQKAAQGFNEKIVLVPKPAFSNQGANLLIETGGKVAWIVPFITPSCMLPVSKWDRTRIHQ